MVPYRRFNTSAATVLIVCLEETRRKATRPLFRLFWFLFRSRLNLQDGQERRENWMLRPTSAHCFGRRYFPHLLFRRETKRNSQMRCCAQPFPRQQTAGTRFSANQR